MKQYKSQVFPKTEGPFGEADYFSKKLFHESDIADLAFDFFHDLVDYSVIDVRSKKDYKKVHIPGALSYPNGILPKDTFPKDSPILVYCWGPSCNGATKSAARLTAQGYRVKELIGGIEYWLKENCPVEGSDTSRQALYWQYGFLNR
ncbi:rhodanese-like domain-containing protein [Listeria booriae]|uniref:rhodanese-like domain-containing protein n=1 Tax=Listeria booriae TaxID=1552123 RepID=UPI0016279470|nr:rhodanese-like domain-containing protein [Listeria booriae]MBC1558589.1 rhodanese-like domain-containing protein [Listeria booriae]